MQKPKYTPPVTLKVTGLRPETLQTWVNRGIVQLEQQNPGRGKRRLYSALDVVKLAIMRRTDDLGISLGVAKDWAEGAVSDLSKNGKIDWNLYLSHRPKKSGVDVAVVSSHGSLAQYSPTVGDPYFWKVCDLIYPDDERRDRKDLFELGMAEDRYAEYQKQSIKRVVQNKDLEDEEEFRRLGLKLLEQTHPNPINREKRTWLAKRSIHAEPIIIFPLGEIANGALAQLQFIDEEVSTQDSKK